MPPPLASARTPLLMHALPSSLSDELTQGGELFIYIFPFDGVRERYECQQHTNAKSNRNSFSGGPPSWKSRQLSNFIKHLPRCNIFSLSQLSPPPPPPRSSPLLSLLYPKRRDYKFTTKTFRKLTLYLNLNLIFFSLVFGVIHSRRCRSKFDFWQPFSSKKKKEKVKLSLCGVIHTANL